MFWRPRLHRLLQEFPDPFIARAVVLAQPYLGPNGGQALGGTREIPQFG